MKLSIITINYNGSESTLNLLKSLANQTDKSFQIVVIDNASEEADFEVLKNYCATYFETVTGILMRNSRNLGFSGGNNIGIKKALNPPAGGGSDPASGGASWVVLLNNDTWVESGFVGSLKGKISQLEGLSNASGRGIVGIPLIEHDHTAYYGKIEWLKPTLKHAYNPPYAEYLRRNRNYYAIGGAMAIHKTVFDKIGFFDEKYFLYFEDADFNIRASKAGVPISFLDEPKARHRVSGTTSKLGSPMLLRYHYRNSLYFNLKNGPQNIKTTLWFWSSGVVIKQLLKIMFMYKQAESLAILRAVFDFYFNKMGKIA